MSTPLQVFLGTLIVLLMALVLIGPRRIACLFTGHVWAVRRINARKHGNLAHLHPMAGKDADCKRCGKVWSDSGIEAELLAEIKATPRGSWRIPVDQVAREAIESMAERGEVVCIADRDASPEGDGPETIDGMGRASFGSRVRLP